MTYQTEFPDFEPSTMPQIPAGWTDQSWHNDSCPSFNTDADAIVYIDYLNPQDREIPEGERFVVLTDPEFTDNTQTVFGADDWNAVLAYIICRKWVKRIGGGFHPDTRGASYSPALEAPTVAEYDSDMEALFGYPGDPYALAVKAMKDAGLLP